MPVWAPPWKPWLLLNQGYTGVASWSCYMRLCYACVMATLRLCYGCYSGCCISQERITCLQFVPTAPQVFFQPLSSRLAYPGFSKQCEQQDPVLWTGSAIHQCSRKPSTIVSVSKTKELINDSPTGRKSWNTLAKIRTQTLVLIPQTVISSQTQTLSHI